MLTKYIDIKINLDPKDPNYNLKLKKYTDLAIAFDNIRVANEIIKLRNILNIENIYNAKQYKEYIRSIINTNKYKKLLKIIDASRRKAMLPYHFGNALLSAVFCNFVTEGSYNPVIIKYEDILLHDFRDDFGEDGEIIETVCHLIVGPMTRKEDVIFALEEYQKQVDNISGIENYEYIPKTAKRSEALPAINVTREWFILKDQGYSIDKIREKFETKCPYGAGHITNGEKPGRFKKPLGCTCYSNRYIAEQISKYKNLIDYPILKRK